MNGDVSLMLQAAVLQARARFFIRQCLATRVGHPSPTVSRLSCALILVVAGCGSGMHVRRAQSRWSSISTKSSVSLRLDCIQPIEA